MKYVAFILGFFFNIGYLVEAAHLPISGVSVIYLIVLVALILIGRLAEVRLSKKYFIFISFFLFYYTLTYIIFPRTEYSNYKYFMMLAKLPAVLLIPYCLGSKYKDFFKGYLLALGILMLMLIAQSGSMLSTAAPDINTRLEVGVLNPIWISRLIFEGFLVAALVLRFSLKYMLIIFIISMPVVYVSGSKGPILAYLISYGLYHLHKVKINIRHILSGLLLVAFVGAAIQLTGGLDNNSYFVQRFLRAVPDESSDEMKEMSRVMVWPQTIFKLSNAPVQNVLFGFGPGNFSYLYWGKYSNDRLYPHNIILELLVEQGSIFVIIVFCGFVYFYRKSRNNFKFIMIFFIINAMFSGDIILNEQLFFYLSFALMSNSSFNESRISDAGELSEPAYN